MKRVEQVEEALNALDKSLPALPDEDDDITLAEFQKTIRSCRELRDRGLFTTALRRAREYQDIIETVFEASQVEPR